MYADAVPSFAALPTCGALSASKKRPRGRGRPSEVQGSQRQRVRFKTVVRPRSFARAVPQSPRGRKKQPSGHLVKGWCPWPCAGTDGGAFPGSVFLLGETCRPFVAALAELVKHWPNGAAYALDQSEEHERLRRRLVRMPPEWACQEGGQRSRLKIFLICHFDSEPLLRRQDSFPELGDGWSTVPLKEDCTEARDPSVEGRVSVPALV